MTLAQKKREHEKMDPLSGSILITNNTCSN